MKFCDLGSYVYSGEGKLGFIIQFELLTKSSNSVELSLSLPQATSYVKFWVIIIV